MAPRALGSVLPNRHAIVLSGDVLTYFLAQSLRLFLLGTIQLADCRSVNFFDEFLANLRRLSAVRDRMQETVI